MISTVALAAALLLALIAAGALNLNLRRLRESFSWVDHTDRVLLEIGYLQSELGRLTAAARSYSVTGEPASADLLNRAQTMVPRAVATIRPLVADDPDQSKRLEELGGLASQYVARLQQITRDPSADSIDGPEQRQLGSGITTAMDELRSTEIARLARREQVASDSVAFTTWFAGSAMLLAFVSGGLGILLIQRERQRHRLLELETELMLVSRLNTVGQTASVLAHEVNQPLSATRNYLSAARRLLGPSEAPEAPRLREAIDLAERQVERASQIVSRLRRHVRGSSSPDRANTAVATLIEDSIALSGMRSAELEIRQEVERGLPEIFVDAGQVQQVLINLVRNGVEAMENSDRREMVVAARRDGNSIVVNVRDTGIGMSEEMAARLFRPFTSTKSQGMGVGLSICRSIIEAHGGRIWAEPNLDRGTTFTFTLPITRAAASSPVPASQPQGSALASPG